ncbi:unnamed protein product [Gongylonema pulchrum]|uniref:RRM domain-containing protein n=1 Tax=Gongylonema pulchrum TaxID=637853 RepID=A0A183CX54_9BILA|nr:unnamed protein product [Gongylonema pulchrum]
MRVYNADGQASDRWIAEFNSFDLCEKAYHIRGKIGERPVRSRRITNEIADELLAIPDKFGRQRKEEYERKQAHTDPSTITPLLDVNTSSSRPGEPMMGPNFHNPVRGGRGGRGRGGLYRGALLQGSYGGEREAPIPPPLAPPSAAALAADKQSSTAINGVPPSTSAVVPPRMPTFRPRTGLLPTVRPRPPLISPPTFFGNTTPSTIRQRGPPPSGHGPPLLRGPRPTLFPPTNGPAGPIIPPPSVKACLMIEKVPQTTSDTELAQLLHLSQASQGSVIIVSLKSKSHGSHLVFEREKGFYFSATIRRAADGLIYIEMSGMDEATKTVQRHSGMRIGDSIIAITAITRQQMQFGLEKKAEAVETLEPELIASVGEPGTVISCHGFPANVTLTDVAQFFDKYSLVESSVRIKLDDNGTPTGECLLAVGSPQVTLVFCLVFGFLYRLESK